MDYDTMVQRYGRVLTDEEQMKCIADALLQQQAHFRKIRPMFRNYVIGDCPTADALMHHINMSVYRCNDLVRVVACGPLEKMSLHAAITQPMTVKDHNGILVLDDA